MEEECVVPSRSYGQAAPLPVLLPHHPAGPQSADWTDVIVRFHTRLSMQPFGSDKHQWMFVVIVRDQLLFFLR